MNVATAVLFVLGCGGQDAPPAAPIHPEPAPTTAPAAAAPTPPPPPPPPATPPATPPPTWEPPRVELPSGARVLETTPVPGHMRSGRGEEIRLETIATHDDGAHSRQPLQVAIDDRRLYVIIRGLRSSCGGGDEFESALRGADWLGFVEEVDHSRNRCLRFTDHLLAVPRPEPGEWVIHGGRDPVRVTVPR